MAFTVEVDVDRKFEVECTPERAFEVLSDVPWSVSHFPKVERLVDLGGNTYRWEMEKIGFQSYYIQTIYACKYVSDPEKLTVKWSAVKDEGNAIVSGQWKIKGLKSGATQLHLSTKGAMELPFPSLLRLAVGPFVRNEFESLIDTYIENLSNTLESNKKKPKSLAGKKAK